MNALMLILTATALYLGLLTFVVALCKSAARGDDAQSGALHGGTDPAATPGAACSADVFESRCGRE